MLLLEQPLNLQIYVYSKLTLPLLKTSITANTPAKPMDFAKVKFMLKLCGFSIYILPKCRPEQVPCLELKCEQGGHFDFFQ
jgi:hypothetical protein